MKSKPFDGSASIDWSMNAILHLGSDKWDLYATSFLDATNFMLKAVLRKETGLFVNTAVYPIVFLYRHYLELRLKQLTIKFSKLFGTPSPKSSHGLLLLLDDLIDIITQNTDPVFRMMVTELIGIRDKITLIDQLDKNSEAFRYPENNKHIEHLKNQRHFNIEEFETFTIDVANILEGIAAWMDAIQDDLGQAWAEMQLEL